MQVEQAGLVTAVAFWHEPDFVVAGEERDLGERSSMQVGNDEECGVVPPYATVHFLERPMAVDSGSSVLLTAYFSSSVEDIPSRGFEQGRLVVTVSPLVGVTK
mmetsp:Transcript_138930/g.443623  ORF Transcript_138930/g.443623 Transcript_138930/m.443623 type:complete len:103 (+) Transcript_138930:800-1108(+)